VTGIPAAAAPPLVSIALPVFNGERYLRTALDCIAAQTCRDYELVIVDNGSTDRTPEICHEYAARDPRIRYVRYEGTVPVVDNFWRAFQHTRGTFFLWNAADDTRPCDAIDRALEVFRRHPDTVMVHGPVELDLPLEGRTIVVANDVAADGPNPAARVAAIARRLRHNGMLYGVYRRDALARVVFRQHFGQDFLVCLQMALIGPIRYLERPIVRYRHVQGPTDNPMYERRPLTLRRLVAWPVTGYKCLFVLWRGCRYLLREPGSARTARVLASAAYVGAFTARFWRHLATELVLVAGAPAAWALRLLIDALRGWNRRIPPVASTQ
jgi:glycosyltransferase involved in cell wall biosynthesis